MAERVRRWLLRGTAIALAVVLLCLAALAGLIGTRAGRLWAVELALDNAPTPGLAIGIRDLDWPSLGRISLAGLTLADDGGTWLELGALQVDWQPAELLTGTLAIDRVALARLALLQLPQTPPSQDSAPAPLELPRLPLSLRLGAFDVGAIEIAPAVAGEAVKLQGAVSLRWPEREALALQTTLKDTGGGRTALSADVLLSPDLNLTADVAVTDQQRGILAGLLGVADWPETRVSLQGQGPLAGWRGRALVAVGEIADADAAILADLAELRRIAVNVTGRAGPGLPALFGLDGMPEARLAAEVELLEGTRLELAQAVVTTAASRVEVSGIVHADGRIEGARLRGQASPAEWQVLLPPEVGLAELTFDGTAAGSLAQPEAALQLLAGGLSGPDGLALRQLECRLGLRPADTGQAFDADCAIVGASGHPALRPALGEEARLRLSGNLWPEDQRVALSSLQLDGAALRLAGSGQVAAAVGDGLPPLRFDLRLTSSDVAPLARALELPLSGALSAMLQGSTEEGAALAGQLSLDASPQWPAELAVPKPLQGAVAVSAHYRLDADQRLVLRDGRLSAGRLRGTMAGTAELPDGSLAAQLRLTMPDSHRLELPTGGFAEGDSVLSVKVAGTVAGPRLSGALSTPDLLLPGAALQSPRATFDVRVEKDDVAGGARLDLAVSGRPASAAAGFRLSEGEVLRVSAIDLQAPGARLTGELAGRLQGNLWQGQLALQAPVLAEPASLVGQPLDGSAEATVVFDASDGRQNVAIEARFADLSWLQGDAAVLVDRIDLSGSLRDLFGTPDVRARAGVHGVLTPQAMLETVELVLDGGFESIAWTGALEAEMQAPLRLSAAGTLALQDARTTLLLSRMDGRLAETPLRLVEPATISVAADGQVVGPLVLELGSGRLLAEAALSPQALRGRFRLVALPLAPIALFASGLPLEGALDAEADLDWSAQAPSLNLQALASGLRLPDESEDWPAAEVNMRAGWQGRTLTVSGDVGGVTEEPGRFEAKLPLVAGAVAPEVDLPADGPLSARLQWRGEIGPLVRLLPLSEHRLRGRGLLDLGVAGTIAEPHLTGTAQLDGGAYRHLYWGTEFRDIAMTAEGDSAGSLSLRGSASDAGEGRLAIEGAVALAQPDQPNGWLTVSLRQVRALARDELKGEVSADIRLEGGLEELLLSGLTTVDRMEIQIPDRLPPSVVELQVEEVGRPSAGAPAEEGEQPAGPLTRLDLTVSMPARVFVRGRGLDSEWGGQLRITGTSRKPEIAGSLNVIRGKFSFAGRSFDISTGTLRFRGGDDVDPEIEVVIAHSRTDLEATITLSGPVSAPALSLKSVPSLPDDEILARIVFGKSVRELSPLQSLQLAQSVAEISGAVGGGGVMSTLRETLGVDALTVDSGEDGSTKVGVGKYLLENVYVGVRQGATAGSGELAAEIELTPNLSLQSEIGQDARSNIDLNWHFDY